MACTGCTSNSKSQTFGYVNLSALMYYPFNATDIKVYNGGETRSLTQEDWPQHRHKLLLFYPETFTPVCSSEMGAINDWVKAFDELNCDIYSVTTDPIETVKNWYESEESISSPNYRALSSFLLPQRLNINYGYKTKRASVFITTEGEVITQEHFMNVGRSIQDLHRTLYAYSTGSFCAENWQSPEDGFLKD